METKASWSTENIQMINQLNMSRYKAEDETLTSAFSSSKWPHDRTSEPETKRKVPRKWDAGEMDVSYCYKWVI